MPPIQTAIVAAVSRSPTHTMTKPNADTIRLVAGLGVDGDAHQGATVKHRSRIERFGHLPNLRQVHLIHAELFRRIAAPVVVSRRSDGRKYPRRAGSYRTANRRAASHLGRVRSDRRYQAASRAPARQTQPADGGDAHARCTTT